jgi:hypothetical protein
MNGTRPQAARPNAGRNRDDRSTIVLQVLGIVGLVLMVATVLHKASADVSQLAQQHSGVDFWLALARQMLRNLSGG